MCWQVFKDASHALLQEANVNLAQLMKDEGFYVERRRMSVPIKKRSKASFGSAFPIELPTMKELDIFADGYVTNCVSCKNNHLSQLQALWIWPIPFCRSYMAYVPSCMCMLTQCKTPCAT